MSRLSPELLPPADVSPVMPEQYNVGIVDLSQDIHDMARDVANERYTNMMNAEGGRVRRLTRNIWKGTGFKGYYIQKFTEDAKERARTQETLYIRTDNLDERQAATQATVRRFTSEYDEHIHDGEVRHWLSTDANTPESRVITGVKGIIERYATGGLNDEQLTQERRGLFGRLANDPETADLVPKGEIYADNIEIIARNVRAALEHGASLEEALARVKVASGEARTGVRTAAEHNRIDKVIEKVNKSKVGTLIGHPKAVISAVSIAASLAGFGSKKAIYAAGKTVAPGIAGAVVGGFQENYKIKEERRQHSRERAQGGDHAAGAKRREGMEKTRYETVSARDMARALELALDNDGMPRTNLSVDQAQEVMRSLSSAVARTELSDTTKHDFIGYDSVTQVEEQRHELDLRIAQAKAALRGSLEFADGDALRSSLGMEVGQEIEVALDAAVGTEITGLQTDITEKDAAFKSLRRREVAKAAAKAGLIGMGIGLAFQEGLALVDPNRVGLLETGLFHPTDKAGQHETLLKGMFSRNSHNVHTVLATPEGRHTEAFNSNGDATLPTGFALKPNGENTFDMFNSKGESIATLHTNADGSFTNETMAMLSDRGIGVTDAPQKVTSFIETTRPTTSASEYLHANGASTVHRDGWYDNNTRAFDRNELKLWWGGEDNIGTDPSGNYLMSVSQMMKGGSFHNGLSADWQQEAASGRLQAFVTASRGTQTEGFFVPIDARGNFIISHDSPAAQLFSRGPNGQAIFHGNTVEVAQVTGQDTSGAQHIRMLATEVGKRDATQFSTVDHVPVDHLTHHYSFDNLHETTDVHTDDFIEMAPYIPIYGRKALEALLDGEASTEIPAPSYYDRRRLSEEEADRRARDFSPRLHQNPEARLNDEEEIGWYLDQQTPAYRRRLRNLAEETGRMGENVDVVVTIPVAGHQEADNIYRTLEAYLDQTMPRDRFEIDLYVNNPVTNSRGIALDSDNTLTEIERFRTDHPELPVRVFHEVLPRNDAKIGKIRKTLVDSVLQRHKDRLDQGSDKDLVLVSNDADAIRVNPQYLETMLGTLKNNERLDAVLGQIDWDNKAYVNYPEVHIGTRLYQFFDTIVRNKEGLIAATSGANTAFRASMYAAVGGYKATNADGFDIDIAEDVELGRDMRAGRYRTGIDPVGFGGVKGSRIETSARRAIWTWQTHMDSPYNQWNYGFSADDDAVRDIKIDSLSPRDFADPVVRSKLTSDIERVINSTLSGLGPSGSITSGSVAAGAELDQATAQYLVRSLHLLGVDFEWDGSFKAIKIKNADAMLDGLAEYANKAQRKEATRRGGAILKITAEVDEKSGAQRFRGAGGRYISRENAVRLAST